MNDIQKPEDLLQPIIFLYDVDYVDGELIGELARRSFQKNVKSVNIYVTTIIFATSTTSTYFSKPSDAVLVACLFQRLVI